MEPGLASITGTDSAVDSEIYVYEDSETFASGFYEKSCGALQVIAGLAGFILDHRAPLASERRGAHFTNLRVTHRGAHFTDLRVKKSIKII